MQGIRVEKRLIIRSGEIYLEKDGLKIPMQEYEPKKSKNLMCKQKYVCETINSYARNVGKFLCHIVHRNLRKYEHKCDVKAKIKLIWSNIPKKEDESVPGNRRKRRHQ